MLLSSTSSIVAKYGHIDSAIRGNSTTTVEWIVGRAFIIKDLDADYKLNKSEYKERGVDAKAFKAACGIDKSVWSRAMKIAKLHTGEQLDAYVSQVTERAVMFSTGEVPTEKGYIAYLEDKPAKERKVFEGFEGKLNGEPVKIPADELTPEQIAALQVLGFITE